MVWAVTRLVRLEPIGRMGYRCRLTIAGPLLMFSPENEDATPVSQGAASKRQGDAEFYKNLSRTLLFNPAA